MLKTQNKHLQTCQHPCDINQIHSVTASNDAANDNCEVMSWKSCGVTFDLTVSRRAPGHFSQSDMRSLKNTVYLFKKKKKKEQRNGKMRQCLLFEGGQPGNKTNSQCGFQSDSYRRTVDAWGKFFFFSCYCKIRSDFCCLWSQRRHSNKHGLVAFRNAIKLH